MSPTHQSVGQWLGDLGLGQYAAAFEENAVDFDVLADLTSEDLKEIGVSAVGHRRKILASAAKLTEGEEPSEKELASTRLTEEEFSERRVMTVMFCDLVGSTAIAAVSDAEDYRDFIDDFRREVEIAVNAYGGAISQFLGDGVMASFGYPVASGHDAERAAASALAVVDRINKMPPFAGRQPQVRVGLATGMTVVGALMTGGLRDDSAIGDTANLASRLQTTAAPGTVVVSRRTHTLLEGLFKFRNLGELNLKGIPEPQPVWQVIGASESASRYEALSETKGVDLFVGRRPELTLLTERYNAARLGRESTTLVVGESGIGKSRLAHECIANVMPMDRTPVVLQCSPYHTRNAFFPVFHFLSHSAGLSSSDDSCAAFAKIDAWLGSIGHGDDVHTSLLGRVLQLEEIDEIEVPLKQLTPGQIRFQSLELISRLLVEAVGTGGVLLIEDIQWLDPTTSQLLEITIPKLRDTRAWALATGQLDVAPDWLVETAKQEFQDQESPGLVRLGRLESKEIAMLAQAFSPDGELPDEVVSAIENRSEGVPIFVTELTRGYLDRNGDHEGVAEEVPLSLAESLVGRLDRLNHGRRVAPIAAALGQKFPVRMLEGIAEVPSEDVKEGIAELTEAGIIEHSEGRFGASIEFRHNLVRKAAYDMLLLRRRPELHSRIARMAKEKFPDVARLNPQLLAFQHEAASEFAQACDEWARAGTDAVSRSAYSEAQAAYSSAVEMLERTEPGKTRDQRELELRLNLNAAEICIIGFQALRESENQNKLIELSQRLGDSTSLTKAVHMRWVQLQISSRFKASRDLAFQALRDFTDVSETDRLILLRMCATGLLFCGQLRDALGKYFEFMDQYDPDLHGEHLRGTHTDHAAVVMMGIAETYTLMAEPELAAPWGRRSVDMANASGRRHDQCHVLTFAGCMHPYLTGDHPTVIANANLMQKLMDQESLPNWAAFPKLFSGLSEFKSGGGQKALAKAREGVDYLLKAHNYGDWPLILYAEACLEAKKIDEAAQVLAVAFVALTESETRFAAEYYRLAAKLLMMRDGNRKEAQANLDKSISIAQRQEANLFLQRAQADFHELTQVGVGKAGSVSENLPPPPPLLRPH